MSRPHREARDKNTAGVSRRGFLRASALAAGGAAAAGSLRAGASSRPQAEAAQVLLEADRVRPGAQIPVRLQGAQPPGRLLPVQVCPQSGSLRPLPVAALRPEGPQSLFVVAPPNPSAEEVYLLALAWQEQPSGRVHLSNTVEVVCTPFYVGM